MFDGALHVQLEIKLLKFYFLKLTVICGVEHTVLILFNDVSKVPIVHQMIAAHKKIYSIFGYSIYHKPH